MKKEPPSWEQAALLDAEMARTKTARSLERMHRLHGKAEGRTCGGCAFLTVNPMETASRYYKCVKYGLSSSAATDWRLKWAACGLFEAKVSSE